MKLFIFGYLISGCLMMIAKRFPALISSFRYQSLFLFLIACSVAVEEARSDLYIVAGLLLAVKVIAIPWFLSRISRRMKAGEDIGLFLNSQVSLVCALGLTFVSWVLTRMVFPWNDAVHVITLTAAFAAFLTGMFLMIFRMTALAQIIGLLVMENGLFLLASSVSGGMPFFVEIAVFFDVFVSVIILGFFVYRINKLFTHIDVNKLSRLKG